jgi:hypothetical protein
LVKRLALKTSSVGTDEVADEAMGSGIVNGVNKNAAHIIA